MAGSYQWHKFISLGGSSFYRLKASPLTSGAPPSQHTDPNRPQNARMLEVIIICANNSIHKGIVGLMACDRQEKPQVSVLPTSASVSEGIVFTAGEEEEMMWP